MRNLYVLAAALEFAEEHLCNHISAEDLAKMCHVSLSCLQKLFHYAFHCSVGEYLSKRKLSAAAYDLVNSEKTITYIAFQYQYSSPEVFTRAFKRFWGVRPSEFRKKHRFSELFPKLKVDFEKGGYFMMKRKNVDVTDLCNELKKFAGTYALCVDICNLAPINKNYGFSAGDIIIGEAARRIDQALSEGMMMFRIGGDEFAALTGYTQIEEAKKIAESIASLNGSTVCYNGESIDLSLRIGIFKTPDFTRSEKEIVDEIMEVIKAAKRGKADVYIGG